MQLGIHAVWLCRNKLQYIWNKVLSIREDYEVINSLDQLNRTKMLRKNHHNLSLPKETELQFLYLCFHYIYRYHIMLLNYMVFV